MERDRLDDLSRQIEKRVLELFPDWREFVRTKKADDFGRSDHLVIEVPAPPGSDVANPLLIHTANDEVTVAFDHYHAHYDWPVDRNDTSIFDNPLALLSGIVREDCAAASCWNDDQWKGSWLVQRSGEIMPDEHFRPMTRIRIRSWKGTLNRDYPFRRD